jgi:hypothetical protein
MKGFLTLVIIISLLSTVSAQENQWDKYIPEKQRKDIMKKVNKATGVGAALSGQNAIVLWVTEPVSRVFTSATIDKKRISNKEADELYQSFRSESFYTFVIVTIIMPVGAFGSRRASSIGNPLAKDEIFLQQKENNKIFSKGEAPAHDFDFIIGGSLSGVEQSQYIVLFPKNNREGKPIINTLNDTIEIQFNLAGKKVVLEYKLKDVTTNLEDL